MALPQFGTLTTFDTLQSSTQTIAQFGEDRAWDGVASMLDSFNEQLKEVSSNLMDTTTSRLRRYGGAVQMELQRMDEMGTPNAQKGKTGVPVGFPLEAYGIAIQWNRLYLKTKKVNEFAAQVQVATTAATRRMLRNIKIALFTGVNYNFDDYLVDHIDQVPLPVKALLNADGAPIPPGPNGEVFNPYTHTHYLASNGLTDAFATAVIETVIEHHSTGTATVWINRADESSWRALADFKPMTYDYVIRSYNQEYGKGTLDTDDLYNRQIGYLNGAEIWTKPYMVAGYFFCYMSGAPQPLVKRIRGTEPNGGDAAEGAGDFTLVYEDDSHPLKANGWEHEYGIAVWTRTNGAVGYHGGNGTVYVQPNIT